MSVPEGEHVDVDTLAELDEDLLGDRADSVRAHLAGCPQCRQAADDLAEVRRTLATAPPARMPAEVADRLDAAVDKVADDRSVVPHRRARHQSRPLKVGLAAAAIAIVAVGGGATARELLTGGSVGSSAAAPQDSSEGGAAAPLSQPNTEGLRVVATGADYSTATVDEQVTALVRHRVAQGSPPPASRPYRPAASPDGDRVPPALLPLTSENKLRGCVEVVTGRAEGRPAVVDLARYKGKPAAVIVGPEGDSGPLNVWIVDPSCSADGAEVLLHTQVST